MNTGVILTIDPGVTVNFTNNNWDLTVNGTFIADGDPGNRITIQNSSATLFLSSSSTGSVIDNVDFSTMGVFNEAALRVSSDATITNCTFTTCEVGVTVDNDASPTHSELHHV